MYTARVFGYMLFALPFDMRAKPCPDSYKTKAEHFRVPNLSFLIISPPCETHPSAVRIREGVGE